MKRSRTSFFSGIRLAVRRSLSKGGWTQFIMPLVLFLLVWLALGGLLAILVGSGAVQGGTLTEFRSGLDDKGPLGIAFYHLFTAGGEDMMESGFGWIVTIIGTILIALLTSIFTNYFIEAAGDYSEGRSDFKFFDHIAVFGFGESVPGLLKQMLDGEYSECYFLVLASGSVPEARAQLASVLTSKQMERVVLLRGDIDSESGVRRMQVDKAQEILIPGEGRDGQTLECLKQLASMLPEGSDVPCYVRFQSRAASSVFQYADIDNSVGGRLKFLPFNSLDFWAHKVFLCGLPLEGPEGIGADSPDHVHLVIAGMTPAGTSLALEAIRLAHYPNKERTRISFVDTGMELKMNKFLASLPGLAGLVRRRFRPGSGEDSEWLLPEGTKHLGGDFLDFELEFIDADISAPFVRQYLESVDIHTRLTVALCQTSHVEALDSAVALPAGVLERAVQVLVYQPEDGAVTAALANGSNVSSSPLGKLKAFGAVSEEFDLALFKSLLAAASRLHIDTSGGAPASRSSASQLWSDIYCACHISTKRRSAGTEFASSREELARAEHNRWNADQLLMNYRPLTAEEQRAVLRGSADLKSAYKRERRAHLDICSWERLAKIDPEVVRYDYDMVDKAAAI